MVLGSPFARAQTDRILMVQTEWDLFYSAIYYTDSSQLTQVSTLMLLHVRTKKLISIEGTSAYEDLHSINPEINLAAS